MNRKMIARTNNPVLKRSLLAGILLAALPLMAGTWTDPATGITWTYTVSDGKASVGGGSLGSPAVSTSTQGAITVPSAIGGKPVPGGGQFRVRAHLPVLCGAPSCRERHLCGSGRHRRNAIPGRRQADGAVRLLQGFGP